MNKRRISLETGSLSLSLSLSLSRTHARTHARGTTSRWSRSL